MKLNLKHRISNLKQRIGTKNETEMQDFVLKIVSNTGFGTEK